LCQRRARSANGGEKGNSFRTAGKEAEAIESFLVY
jgi:hypothetical protein